MLENHYMKARFVKKSFFCRQDVNAVSATSPKKTTVGILTQFYIWSNLRKAYEDYVRELALEENWCETPSLESNCVDELALLYLFCLPWHRFNLKTQFIASFFLFSLGRDQNSKLPFPSLIISPKPKSNTLQPTSVCIPLFTL